MQNRKVSAATESNETVKVTSDHLFGTAKMNGFLKMAYLLLLKENRKVSAATESNETVKVTSDHLFGTAKMNGFLKMAYLLLLKVTAEALNATGDTEIVFHAQTPRVVHLGSSLTLNCSFDIKEPDRVRVDWLLGKSQQSDQGLQQLSSGLANGTWVQETKGPVTQWTSHAWSSLTLRDITSNYSGWYFCEVWMEIPLYTHSRSSGIEVNITSSLRGPTWSWTTAKHITSPSPASPPRGNTAWWVWVMVGVGSLVLTAVSVGILCRRTKCQNKESPIYENMRPVCKSTVPPQRSPRPKTELIPSHLPSSIAMGTPKML
ncbi:hypothetical protein COCON_G00059680 [Conger conger]|uniref:Ig-like domain-containing protein n=1 Tax=Conger conger TaxID=82655 RepID=A0A9Q1DR33_CONCO|nr:hypothetical protein COCON_G00059680 [Conger conger]